EQRLCVLDVPIRTARFDVRRVQENQIMQEVSADLRHRKRQLLAQPREYLLSGQVVFVVLVGDGIIAAKSSLGADGDAGDIAAAVRSWAARAQFGIVRLQVDCDRTLTDQGRELRFHQ